jgi:hypothetical protein
LRQIAAATTRGWKIARERFVDWFNALVCGGGGSNLCCHHIIAYVAEKRQKVTRNRRKKIRTACSIFSVRNQK